MGVEGEEEAREGDAREGGKEAARAGQRLQRPPVQVPHRRAQAVQRHVRQARPEILNLNFEFMMCMIFWGFGA